jgi:hypothetical protein
MFLAAMVRDESPDAVADWLRGMTEQDRIDLLLIGGAALPETTKGFQAAWAWCEGFSPAPVSARAVSQARQKGFRDVDIARALRCRVDELPARMKVA